MHDSSLHNMNEFKKAFVYGKNKRVLDVGSYNVNGSYRDLFAEHTYIGFDMRPGPNVDVTDWDDVATESFDYVISGQTFEHVENDVELMENIFNVLKPDGLICIIAPSTGERHDYPSDYRRYHPEDFITLAELTGFEVIEAKINGALPWNDCVLIARKPL